MIGVYVLADADDKPLYVGASNDIARRIKQHRDRKPHWWRSVADVWTYPTDTRSEAHDNEQRLIQELRPPFNRMLRSSPGRPCAVP